jgi:hypothetical protein
LEWLKAALSLLGEMLASPAVLIADMFHPERTLTRRWLLAFLLLLAMVNAVGWGFVFAYRQQVEFTWGVLSRYGEAATEIGNLPYADEIRLFAAEQELDPALVAAVIDAESSFRADAVSRAGARGLMQILPATWRSLFPGGPCRGDHPPPSCGDGCVYDPAASIRAGCRHLRYLLDVLGGNLVAALAAYNAGAATVQALDPKDVPIPPFPETENYVRQVLARWSEIRARAENVSPVRRLAYPGEVNFVPAGAALGLWALLGAWILVKARRVGDWERYL